MHAVGRAQIPHPGRGGDSSQLAQPLVLHHPSPREHMEECNANTLTRRMRWKCLWHTRGLFSTAGVGGVKDGSFGTFHLKPELASKTWTHEDHMSG